MRWGVFRPCLQHPKDSQAYLHETMLTEFFPSMGISSIVMPLRTPSVSPPMNPVSSVKKWLMRSSDPSRLISSPWWLQKGRLSSSPVGSKVRESLLTICGAQKNSWWVSWRRPTSYSRHALKIQGTLRSLTFQNTKPVLRKEAKSSCPLALQWRAGMVLWKS